MSTQSFCSIQSGKTTFALHRRRPPHLGIHVGAVQVDLAAVGVDEITHLPNVLLEHAEGGGVGEHHGCQAGLVFVHLEREKKRKKTRKKVKKKEREKGKQTIKCINGEGLTSAGQAPKTTPPMRESHSNSFLGRS